MNTYLIEEKNDWEGEIFGYLIELSDDDAKEIEELIKNYENLSMQKKTLSDKKIKEINRYSQNSYMSRMGKYELVATIDKLKEMDIPFYKGLGLKKIK